MAANISQVAEKTFDYVVVGGGTAGLTVSARLAGRPEISVAVLEAGEANLDDPLIMLGGQYAATWGNPKYDWHRFTVPQKYLDNRECQWTSGKGLGGSSGMNFALWSMPHAADLEPWEKLGNDGWNWEFYSAYAKRIEHYTEVTQEQLDEFPHAVDASAPWGTSGPIKTTIPWMNLGVEKMFFDSLAELGVPDAKSPYGGDNTGKFSWSSVYDRAKKWTRSYSATAYYLPNKDKPNYKVLTEAQVTRIIFSDRKVDGELIATGVEFEYKGSRHVVHARKEIILSAGTVISPSILEHSGIGRKEVLDSIGVPSKLELPGVGENVQDHVWSAISYVTKPDSGHTSFDMMRDPAFRQAQDKLQELGQKNMYHYGIIGGAFLPIQTMSPESAESFIERATSYLSQRATLPSQDLPTRDEQYHLQLDVLKNPQVGDIELVSLPAFMTWLASAPDPRNIYYSVLVALPHPFSRGTIHAASSDPLEKPVIDPRTFENPLDVELMLQGMRYVRKMSKTAPFVAGVVHEADPGKAVTSDEDMKAYIRKTLNTVHHPIGSLSMLPREKNGCVDTKLKLYGVTNLRVCDNSVLPLHFTAHTQISAYVVGEILADIILGSITN